MKYIHIVKQFQKHLSREQKITLGIVCGLVLWGAYDYALDTLRAKTRAQETVNVSSLFGTFNGGGSDALRTTAFGDSFWLTGGGTFSQERSLSPRLLKYTGSSTSDLSGDLKNFNNTSVTSIGWNGSYWLIGGKDTTDKDPFTTRLNKYQNGVLSDLSAAIGKQGIIEDIEWNGSYWLVATTNHKVPGLPPYLEGRIFRFDGQTFTQIFSTENEAVLRGTSINDIEWNGSYWLIGFNGNGRGGGSLFEDPPTSRLYTYNGVSFTPLYPVRGAAYSVHRIAANESYWLISLSSDISRKPNLWKYDGTTFTDLTPLTGFSENELATAMTWNGTYWILGTTLYTNSQSDESTAHAVLEKNTASLVKYDGSSFTRLVSNLGVVIHDISYAQDRGVFLAVGQNAQLQFLAQEVRSIKAADYPDDTLLRAEGRPEVFVVKGGKKKFIANEKVFASYGYRFEEVRTTPLSELDATPDIKVIKTTTSSKVYYLDAGRKRWIRNLEIAASYGIDPREALLVTQIDLDSYADVRLVRKGGEPEVYYITETGLRRHVPTAEIFNSYGNRWDAIVSINHVELAFYKPVVLIRREGDYRVYKLDQETQTIQWIETAAAFTREGFNWSEIAPVNQTEFGFYKTDPSIK